jgi:hypothetical protein
MKIDSIQRWMYHDEDIGTEALQIDGAPGSGKSNMANLLMSWLLLEGECGITRATNHCEWRHFCNYIHPIKLLYPEELEGIIKDINFSLKTLEIHNDFSIDTFPSDEPFDIIPHLSPGKIVAVYDGGYSLGTKGWLWADVFDSLVKRETLIDTPVVWLDHEAGILLPEVALSTSKSAESHWRAVNRVAELFVDFRKNLVRPIMVSQEETEIYHRIRSPSKCFYHVHRRGGVAKWYSDQVKHAAPRLRIDQYITTVGKGEIWTLNNQIEKFREIKTRYKMVVKTKEEIKYLPDIEEEKTLPNIDEIDIIIIAHRLNGETLTGISAYLAAEYGVSLSYQAVQHRIQKIKIVAESFPKILQQPKKVAGALIN